MRRLAFAILLALLASTHAYALGNRPCVDVDGDGYSPQPTRICPHVDIDCDDVQAGVHPGSVETCNGKDDNCNGKADEGFRVGQTCFAGKGECSASGRIACAVGGKEASCDAVAGMPKPEVCGNGRDEDCDGVVDNGCSSPPPPSPPTPVRRDRHALYPGSWPRGSVSSPSAESRFLANAYSLLVLGPGTGSTRLDEVYAAADPGNAVTIVRYTKIVGLKTQCNPPSSTTCQDAYKYGDLLAAGVIARDSYPAGNICVNTFNGWHYVNVLDSAPRGIWISNRIQLIAAMTAERPTQGVYFDNSGILIVPPSSGPPAGNEFVSVRPFGYSDAAWYAGVRAVLAAVRAAYPGELFATNSYLGFGEPGLRGLDLLEFSDVLFFEGWATKQGSTGTPDFLVPARYRQTLADTDTAMDSYDGGKTVVAIDDFNSADNARRMWRLASFLLMYRMNGQLKEASRVHDVDPEVTELHYPVEYDAIDVLGRPIGKRHDPGSGVIDREYENGWVWVNPETSSRNITIPAGAWSKLGVVGTTRWNDATANVTWTSIPSGTFTLASNTALVARRTPVADQAAVRARWARTLMRGSEASMAEVGVHVVNTGDQVWAPNSRKIRAHVCLPDGTYIRDSATNNQLIAGTVNPGDEFDQTIQVFSEPDTQGVRLAMLFHPDTVIVPDVVRDTVGWIGNPCGSIRMGDQFRSGQAPGVLERALREGMTQVARGSATASGSEQTLVDVTVPAGHTYILAQLMLSITTQPQGIDLRVTRMGSSENTDNRWRGVAGTSIPLPVTDARLLPGDRVRVVLLSNGSGGTAEASLHYADLPWRDDR